MVGGRFCMSWLELGYLDGLGVKLGFKLALNYFTDDVKGRSRLFSSIYRISC